MATGSGKVSELTKIPQVTRNTRIECVDTSSDDMGFDNFYLNGLQLEQFMVKKDSLVDKSIDAASGIKDFEPNRFYRKGAAIQRPDGLYRAKNEFTSGTTFDETNWEMVSTGTSDYEDLENKPAVGGITLNKNSTAAGLGLETASDAGNNDDLETTNKTTKVAAINELVDTKANKATTQAALDKKANIYVRLAQGITVGNNIQGMHIMPSPDPFPYDHDWKWETAAGDYIQRDTATGITYYDSGSGNTTVIVDENNVVLIDDFKIAQQFYISAMTGPSDANLFYRYFDIRDLDQRIGLVSALLTADKSSVVNAINSLKGYVDGILGSSEVSGSPYESYAAFLADAGASVTPSKYAYVTFTSTDTWPSGGKWDEIVAGETWRLDCSDTQWLPTSNMTANMTANILDQSATDAIKQAGNDTVAAWLQSYRNNIKSIFASLPTLGKVNTVNDITPDANKNIKETIVVDTVAEMEALIPTLQENQRVNVLQEGSENKIARVEPDTDNMETINRCPSAGSTWTVDRDGYVQLRTHLQGPSASGSAFILAKNWSKNDKLVDSTFVYDPGYSSQIATVSVSKGDIIKAPERGVITSGGFENSTGCYYVPPKITYIPYPHYAVAIDPDYSLTEQPLYKMDPVTKEITPLLWTDGKPLYQRVFEDLNIPNPTSYGARVIATFPDALDGFIFKQQFLHGGDNNWYPQRMQSSGYEYICFRRTEKELVLMHNWSNFIGYRTIFRYTKDV
jgi:hypothetical protein